MTTPDKDMQVEEKVAEKVSIHSQDDSLQKDFAKVDVEHVPALDSMDQFKQLDDMDRLDNDKVLETAEDFSVALVSLQDDPSLPINTFRMWFCGLGFAAFGAVLGMLFVGIFHNVPSAYLS
jgi:hypothetical protein